MVGGITDADSGDPKGIAITATNVTNGALFFSTNNGTSWLQVNPVSLSSALLLAADNTSRVYYQPAADYNGTVSDAITLHAWDQSNGLATGTRASVISGSSAAFSSNTDKVAITITAVNDTPVASGNVTALSVAEDSANSTAQSLGLNTRSYSPGPADESGQTLGVIINNIPGFIDIYKAGESTALTSGATLSVSELQGLQYKTKSNANGSGTLNWTVSDNG
ncbi:MAG: hypothetical protein EB072_10615, partial [Betaproteobacteria bacterium]|nr:hypothetical protein [Betaproteobacteria bacterium]